MKIQSLFLIAVLALGLGCANVGTHAPGWQLAYAHDKSGKRTAGNLNTLIKAVKNGAEVRLVVPDEYNHAEFITQADNVWVRDGNVYAQTTPMVSSVWRGDQLVFVNDSFYWMFNFSTTGARDVIKWQVGEHKLGPNGQENDRSGASWFVR